VLIAEITLDDTTKLGLEWIFRGHGRAFNENFDYITGNVSDPKNFLNL